MRIEQLYKNVKISQNQKKIIKGQNFFTHLTPNRSLIFYQIDMTRNNFQKSEEEKQVSIISDDRTIHLMKRKTI